MLLKAGNSKLEGRLASRQFRGGGGGICKHNLPEVGACYTKQAVNHSAPCMKLFVHIHTSPLKMYETPPHKFP